MDKTFPDRVTGADAWGIEPGYTDAMGNWQDTPSAVRDTLRKLMGPAPAQSDGPSGGPHEAVPCPAPPSRRAWGWAVQLYSLRSSASWGMGDLADLRRLAAWSSNLGARFLQVNPLMAAQAVPPLEASPYYPGSRRFFNPLYLRIEEVPGAAAEAAALAGWAAQGRALNGAATIDRDAVMALKRAALEHLWIRFCEKQDEREFHRFSAEGGEGLAQFAAYCALAETHGNDWRRWPEEFRHPGSPAVAAFAAAHGERIAFHQWLQWILDIQLRRASQAIPLLQDLPIGFDPGGADAWCWQDLLASEATVGAPPDQFNRKGQGWGLPPFIPHRLKACGYAPIRETFRAILKHAGGLRVDHVMGLFRLYWIPPDQAPTHGAYVRYDHGEILSVLSEESRRAKAYVVGEDLGTVEPEVRRTLARWGILGSKVLWFEGEPPERWPESTLASLSTHDLPTLAGLWSGADAQEQEKLGFKSNADALQPLVHKVKTEAGLHSRLEMAEVVRRVHRLLAGSNSALIAVSLEDALAVERRPNLPGTVFERPNWRIPLPLLLEEIEKDPLVNEVAAILDRRP